MLFGGRKGSTHLRHFLAVTDHKWVVISVLFCFIKPHGFEKYFEVENLKFEIFLHENSDLEINQS